MQKLLGCNRDNFLELTKHIVKSRVANTFGNPGVYVCEYDGFYFFVKIASHRNLEYDSRKPAPSGYMNPVDAEINIMRALKARIIDTGVSPHISEILAVQSCSDIHEIIANYKPCAQIVEEGMRDGAPLSLLCLIQESIARNMAIDRVSLIFSELCTISLPEFIDKFVPLEVIQRDNLFTSFIFQIYYTLLSITRIWPNFLHGDLNKMDNIMVKISDFNFPQCGYYMRYDVPGVRAYDIPYSGIFIKIIDFGHSKIPEEKIISAIEQNRPERAREIVPDHIDFISEYKNLLLKFPVVFLADVIKTLNPHNINGNMSIRIITELVKKSPTVEQSIAGRAFDMFYARKENDGLILRTYRAPKNN